MLHEKNPFLESKFLPIPRLERNLESGDFFIRREEHYMVDFLNALNCFCTGFEQRELKTTD